MPVPGRDLFVQAWYQGGASLVDFSDSANPVEIGYYDRGPNSAASLVTGGLWSTYWYNGVAYGSEIGRGFDVFGLTPISGQLTQNEIDAAREVTTARLNVQNQQHFVNQPSFAVARSYVDQLVRADDIDPDTLARVTNGIDRAEQFQTGPQADCCEGQPEGGRELAQGQRRPVCRPPRDALGARQQVATDTLEWTGRPAGAPSLSPSWTDGCPRQESNLCTRFRKPLLYPLSYGGSLRPSLGVESSFRSSPSTLR